MNQHIEYVAKIKFIDAKKFSPHDSCLHEFFAGLKIISAGLKIICRQIYMTAIPRTILTMFVT